MVAEGDCFRDGAAFLQGLAAAVVAHLLTGCRPWQAGSGAEQLLLAGARKPESHVFFAELGGERAIGFAESLLFCREFGGA